MLTPHGECYEQAGTRVRLQPELRIQHRILDELLRDGQAHEQQQQPGNTSNLSVRRLPGEINFAVGIARNYTRCHGGGRGR